MTSSPPATGSDIRIRGQRVELAPHRCFACGELNAHGLRLELHADGESCWTELTLDPEFEGWEGLAHGGIVCTILDEVMAWALIGSDAWGLTARMSVEFRRPVATGTLLRAEGRLVRARRRLFEATGRLLDARTGLELATAEGTYVAATEDRRQQLKARYGFRLIPVPGAPGALMSDDPDVTDSVARAPQRTGASSAAVASPGRSER